MTNENKSLGQRVYVWDGAVRLFHWLVVLGVVGMWVSGEVGGDALDYHRLGGYALLTLVLFRILWGFAGSATARFADFLHGPGAILTYLRDKPTVTGHNPLGGWMVLALLLMLLFQGVTGLFSNDDILFDGPLYKWVDKDTSDWLTGLHHLGFKVLLALAAVHVGAIVAYRVVRKENLVLPMFTGYKRLPEGTPAPRMQGLGRALLLLAVATGMVALILSLP